MRCSPTTMKLFTTPRAALLAIITATTCLVCFTIATEQQCQLDCAASNRTPTRPWDAQDPLRNLLHHTRPHPYHIGDNDVHRYEFPEFCKLGCTYFFVSSESETLDKSTLDQCISQCDTKYSYNSKTPPYNDISEMARLECRDGCLMALKRCQSGYYCLQVSFDNEVGSGGDMIPCPPGTYRDVSYDAITECVPCPPNYFREDIKGRSLLACSPCPADSQAVRIGSTTIRDCVRCKAGTFSTEASFCQCITPQACDTDDPSPANAEKEDTVPYIGRW